MDTSPTGLQTIDITRNKRPVISLDEWPYSQGRFIHGSPEWRPGHPDFSPEDRAWKFDNAPAGMPGHADMLQMEVCQAPESRGPVDLRVSHKLPGYQAPSLQCRQHAC